MAMVTMAMTFPRYISPQWRLPYLCIITGHRIHRMFFFFFLTMTSILKRDMDVWNVMMFHAKVCFSMIFRMKYQ